MPGASTSRGDKAAAIAAALLAADVLIPKILSYAIATPRDYAMFRAVSPKWNASVLPRALKASRNLKNCERRGSPIGDYDSDNKNNNNEMISKTFCKELAGFGEGSYGGILQDIEQEGYEFKAYRESLSVLWSKDVRVDSILFVRDKPDTYGGSETIDIAMARDEGYGGVVEDTPGGAFFSEACRELYCDATFWKEFRRTATSVMKKGMFLSVEDFEHYKKHGVKMVSPSHKHQPYYPVVLTITQPAKGARKISGNRVLLGASVDRNELDKDYAQHPLPFLGHPENAQATGENTYMATFVGYDCVAGRYNTGAESITCKVPMMLMLDDELENQILWESTRHFLPLKDLWRTCQEAPISEGVAFCDGVVPPDLHRRLTQQIDVLAEKQILDYHPHSKHIVRDIVHPALYSYVKGVSPLARSVEEVPAEVFDDEDAEKDDDNGESDEDYWGREYEESAKYQWLPTYFDIGEDGECTISDYINNLVPRSEHEDLYGSLQDLFAQALPLIESVYSYCRVVKKHHLRLHDPDDGDDLDYDDKDIPPIRENPVSLRGRRLQVVTKIVDYELGPGQTYEGVWHVEGMSHEEIVATAIYFLDRGPDISGGDILFTRAFYKPEATYIFSHIMQTRPKDVEDAISNQGLVPLGTVETRPGRFLVFPNSHVHKVSKLENTQKPPGREDDDDTATTATAANKRRCSTTQTRRIVVFFLINPEKRIPSTREVPVQQEHVDGGTMKRTDALNHRLELMKERKYTKQDWNIREIELCEH